MLQKFKDWTGKYAMLPLRLALGVIFIAHGAQKTFGWFGGKGLTETVAGFDASGIPEVLAYIAIFTELIGGLCVLIGFATRWASLGLAIVMLVAIFKVHLANGFFMSDKGIEYCLALLGMSLALFLGGPGKPSLDSKC